MSFEYRIGHSTDVSDTRRKVSTHCSNMGFHANRIGDIAIVISELAQNLIKHTKAGGSLVCRFLSTDFFKVSGFEIISVDAGSGLNIKQCLKDGFSTAGSSGTGLGAIQRLSDTFSIYSSSSGTVILTQFFLPLAVDQGVKPFFEGASIVLPISGEIACGDSVGICYNNRYCDVLVSDGLGHGVLANEASAGAVAIFEEQKYAQLDEYFKSAHVLLRNTRGSATSLLRFSKDSEELSFSGIGNVLGAVVSRQGIKRMVTMTGTLGLALRKLQTFKYNFSMHDYLVVHTDGIQSTWNLDQYPGLLEEPPQIIAAILYRDFNRGRDDVGIVVIKRNNEE